MSSRRGRYISDSDEEELDYGQSSKRTKLTNGHTEEMEEDRAVTETEDQAMVVDDDGFVEGSIVKITLTNFVTYDYCEILPGPQMNMIIGPNGTGKSTIVCAIALGLGGTPALLGRAKNIAEFVKTGEDEATICIELKKVGTRNIIIQRTFKKADNTNTWRINGKSTSFREVLSVVRNLNIQVDNLCQFLPQDRVSEFAELSPAQLLERTQAAAGETELHEMQKKLMDWREKEKALEKSQKSDIDHLKTLQTRNAELEKDVMRMQLREEILNKVALLEAQIPLIKYSDAKTSADQIKEQVLHNKEIVERARTEAAPIQELKEECNDEQKRITKKYTDEGLKFKEITQRIKMIANNIQKARENIKLTNSEITSSKRKISESQHNIDSIKAKINQLEESVKTPPSTDFSEFEEAIATVNEESSELRSQSAGVNQKLRDTNNKRHGLEQALKDKKKEIQEMDSARHYRLNKLRNRYPHVYQAFQYCKENPDKFTGKVHGPVVMSINVKDGRYASMVEQVLGGAASSHLRYFIVENEQDYRTFSRILVDEKKLKVNVAWPSVGNEVLRTPTPEAELHRSYGMDYYAIGVLEGDSHVMRYLAQEANITKIPLAIRHENEENISNSGIFQKFCVGETFYNVKTSDYGRRVKQTSTTPIRNAEYLGEAVDQETKAQLVEEYRTMESNLQQADVMIKEYNIEHDQIKQKILELKHKKEDLIAQKRDVQTAAQNYSIKLGKLEDAKKQLELAKQRPAALEAKIQKLEEDVVRQKSEEEGLVESYVHTLEKYVDCYEMRNIYKLQEIHANEKFKAIRNYATEQDKVLRDAENDLATAKRSYQSALRQAQVYRKECEEAGGNLSEELYVLFQEILRKWKEEGTEETLETLEEKIAEEKGRAEGIRFANPDAMLHYEERKVEIDRLQQKIDSLNGSIEECRREIATVKALWEPRIDTLVQRISVKFSEAFERIRCSGEVAVDKHEDFDKWGINIWVKFRDTEKLQLLTGQRQSGGERSVSTVLYLMALQNLAKSPFRVVDEINQGMDPRNERMIHEQIVKGASAPGTSQYFLITPKLLPNLFYNERMRVLCIYNSEWLPAKIKPLSYYLEHAHTNGIT